MIGGYQLGDKVRVIKKVSSHAPDVGSIGTVVPKATVGSTLIEVRFNDWTAPGVTYDSFPFDPSEIEKV